MNRTSKIGVMTFSPITLNPGTVLQSWSLCHFLKTIPGIDPELIWYRSKKSNIPLKITLRSLKIKYYQWRNCGFARRIKKYPLFGPLVSNNIRSINGRYDLILVGSDQVWNPEITGHDTSFFLDFVKGAKKAAYAPSLGHDDFLEEVKPEIPDLLKDFEFIGIREKTSIPAVEKLINKPVHWSLDPSFLTNKAEWSNVAHFPKGKKDSYIMEYCIMGRKNHPVLAQATNHAVKTLGLPVKEIKGWRVSADEWLGYLLNAKLVVTDSFHGVAFCINNNIPFYVIISRNGNRITSVLDFFGLKDRLITRVEEMDLTKDICWEPVNKKLEEVRTENQTWLKESLNKAFKDEL